MQKRTRRPTVEPERLREWLRRNEEDGESPPQIARSDGYDVRTVRKHLQLAREDSELREVRSMVLRQALERHYVDLMTFLADIDSRVKREIYFGAVAKEERMWKALREHLPRSPIWRAMEKLDNLQKRRHQLRVDAETRMQSQVDADTEYQFASELGTPGLQREGLSRVVSDRLVLVARPDAESVEPSDMESGPIDTDLIILTYSGVACAIVPRDEEAGIRQFIRKLMIEVTDWPEVGSMRSVAYELKRVTETLEEEMATILLRRVVPGRCRYCPF